MKTEPCYGSAKRDLGQRKQLIIWLTWTVLSLCVKLNIKYIRDWYIVLLKDGVWRCTTANITYICNGSEAQTLRNQNRILTKASLYVNNGVKRQWRQIKGSGAELEYTGRNLNIEGRAFSSFTFWLLWSLVAQACVRVYLASSPVNSVRLRDREDQSMLFDAMSLLIFKLRKTLETCISYIFIFIIVLLINNRHSDVSPLSPSPPSSLLAHRYLSKIMAAFHTGLF